MASSAEIEEFVERATQILAMLGEKYAVHFKDETVPELMEKLTEEDRAALRHSAIDGDDDEELAELIKRRVIYDPFFYTELQNSKLDMESKIQKLIEWKEALLKDHFRIAIIIRICQLVQPEEDLYYLIKTLKLHIKEYTLHTQQFVRDETMKIQKMMANSMEATAFREKVQQRISILWKKYEMNFQNETIPELMEKLPKEDRAFLQHSIIDLYTGDATTKLMECRVMDDPHLYLQLGSSELDVERKINLILEHVERYLKEAERSKIIMRILEIFKSGKKFNRVW